MKIPALLTHCTAAFALALFTTAAHADPQLSSWFTADSGQYARLYQTTAAETAGTASKTWSRGSGVQTSPTYAGVSEIVYSASWVYIRTSGLASHIMGPWYLDAAKTQLFGNYPSNTATIYRIPRVPAVPGTKTLTGGGAIGYFVNGVAFFDNRDTFSYSNANAKDADPTAGIGTGDGIWVRDALPNENATFDAALAHQAGNQYHYHVQPIALRYQLGDHVDYNATTNRYTESASAVTKHSPIVAWAQDGYPVYGPYAYDGGSTGATATASLSGTAVNAVTVTAGGSLYQSVPQVTFSGGGGSGATALAVLTGNVLTGVTVMNGGSGYTTPPTVTIGGVRRMVSGFQLHNGTNGTTNLNTTGRHTLANWSATWQGRSATLAANQYGPNVSATYALGHYLEDYDYLGDLGFTQGVTFDLDLYNGRFCVTPEFPGGTYAYFSSLNADNSPAFPYNIGRQFYGSPTGGTSAISETVTTLFQGGPNKAATWTSAPVAVAGGNVTLAWSAVEGGTYQVSATSDLAVTATALTPTVLAADDTASAVETGGATSNTKRFYKIARTALATFDANGFNYTQSGGGGGTAVAPGGSAARGTTVTVTITLPTNPSPPPANVAPLSVTLAGTIPGTSVAHTAQGTVVATFAIPAGAPTGLQTINVNFSVTQPPPNYTMTNAFTIN